MHGKFKHFELSCYGFCKKGNSVFPGVFHFARGPQMIFQNLNPMDASTVHNQIILEPEYGCSDISSQMRWKFKHFELSCYGCCKKGNSVFPGVFHFARETQIVFQNQNPMDASWLMSAWSNNYRARVWMFRHFNSHAWVIQVFFVKW